MPAVESLDLQRSCRRLRVDPVSKLTERFAQAREELDLSVRAVVSAAEKGGYRLSIGSVSKYTKGSTGTVPDEATLAALSYALRVPLDEARELAGLPVEQTEFIPHPSASRLTPRQRDAVNEIIRLLAESEQKAGDGDVRDDSRDTSPMNVTDLGGERRRRDDWAFGHRVRGDLGVPPVPEVYAAYESPSEGKARWEEDQARGEESQVPPEDYE